MATRRAHPSPNSMPRSRTKYGRHWRPTIPGSLYLHEWGWGGGCGFILHPCCTQMEPLDFPSLPTPPDPTHVSVISTASAMASSLGLLLGLESQPDNSCSLFPIQREG